MEVSIIIPVYNVAPYIEDCLKSVMRQTFTGPMECLIVDDCGTDDSIPIAERLIADYDGSIRFEILHHERNRGLSAARNTGIEKAVGEYIFFVDSDDEITEDCIEKMMAVARENPEVEMVQGTQMCHRDGKKTQEPKEIRIIHACTNEEVRNCFYQYQQIFVAAWNKLIKRSLIRDNNLFFLEGLLFEDNPWTCFWLKCVKNAYFLPEITYHYKIRSGSIVTGTTKDISEIHRLRGYHAVVTHLTEGYEKQEIKYLTPSYVGLFLHQSYHMPELTNDLRILWHFACKHREYKLCAAIAFCYIFRRTKWLGRIVYSSLLRMMHPTQIPRDFVRIWHWTQRHYRPLFAFHGR